MPWVTVISRCDNFDVFTGKMLNFVYDNTDISVRTLTGLDTWHAMGGIIASTPAQEGAVEPDIHRSTKVRNAEKLGKFSQIDVNVYKKKKGEGVNKVIVGPLEPPKPEPPILTLANMRDSVLLSSFPLLFPLGVTCPNWSGFMQVSVKKETYRTSSIQVLPFINLDPTKLDTIYSALTFAQEQMVKQDPTPPVGKKLLAAVTFDQPLFAKADDIALANPTELDRLFIHLGGFHMAMSYIGGIGFIMKGSGIEDVPATVYAPNTIVHMLIGHAYSRALRGHFLVAAALTQLMIEQRPGCLTGVNTQRLKHLHSLPLEGSCDDNVLLNTRAASQLTHILADLSADLEAESRTGKLWINYLNNIRVLRLFIYAERTGDWDLHLYCVAHMILIFHSPGHFAYARSARRYMDAMKDLPNIIRPDQYLQFTTEGFFTIRRSHRFWIGNFSDQTIKQVLMRQLKSSVGLAHGRWLTASMQSKFVNVIPRCVPICNELETFCGVHAQTSEQHSDLRPTTSDRDATHFSTIYNWIKEHSPFAYAATDGLVNIANGIVAESSSNADNAYDMGKSAADKLTGQKYGETKLKKTDKVTSISAASNAINVGGKEVDVNSSLLFMRITCILKKKQEMADHLCYELSRKPPALFDNGLMRKTPKNVLAKIIMIIDGGHLLQTVPWPKEGTYGDVCNEYIAYVSNHFGQYATCVFDDYDNPDSSKRSEQDRRVVGNICPSIAFNDVTSLSKHNKKEFLNNRENKKKFIKLLLSTLQEACVTC